MSRESKSNMSISEDENTQVSSEDDSEYLSDASEDSFVSETGIVVPYDESMQPVANQNEVAQHAMQVTEEEEEEQMLLSRFSGEFDVREWCVGFRWAVYKTGTGTWDGDNGTGTLGRVCGDLGLEDARGEHRTRTSSMGRRDVWDGKAGTSNIRTRGTWGR